MIFSPLFLGGPAVLQKGINLCAANGIALPFGELELQRLRWTVPFAFFALCVDSLKDFPAAPALRTTCNISFDAWMQSRGGASQVRLGDYIVAALEFHELTTSGKLDGYHFSNIRDLRINHDTLTAHVLAFRCNNMMLKIEPYHELRKLRGHDQKLEFERISHLANFVSLLVYGREPELTSIQFHFIVDVLAEAQKHITSICDQCSSSRS